MLEQVRIWSCRACRGFGPAAAQRMLLECGGLGGIRWLYGRKVRLVICLMRHDFLRPLMIWGVSADVLRSIIPAA